MLPLWSLCKASMSDVWILNELMHWQGTIMFTDKISVTALAKTETLIVSVFARAVIELKVPVLFQTGVRLKASPHVD